MNIKKIEFDKEFSVVMACYNCEKYLNETIESLLNQSFSFKDHIQLILVDDGSEDATAEICQNYVSEYPENIIYIYQENQRQGAARNKGLQYATGKYVNFMDSDDKFREDTFENVFNFFEEHYDEIDLVSVPVDFFDRHHGPHPLNYKYHDSKVIDLDSSYNYPQLFVNSAFFKRELFDEINFVTDLVNSEDALLINKILIKKQSYGVVKEGMYWYRKRSNESSTIDSASLKKDFYLDRLNRYFKGLIDYYIANTGYVPQFIQYLIVYDIQWMFKIEDVSEILTPLELEQVYHAIKDVLNYVEDDIILSLKNDNYNVKNHMLAIKHSNVIVLPDYSVNCVDVHSDFNGNFAEVYSGDILIDQLHIHKIWLNISEIRKNTLFLSGFLMSFFNSKDIEIQVIKTNTKTNEKEIFKPKETFYPHLMKKFLNCTLESSYSFDFEVPLKENENSIVEIKTKYIGRNSTDDSSYNLRIDFQAPARLSNFSNYSINKNHFLEFKDNKFYITPYNYGKMVKNELKVLGKILKNRGPYYTSALAFRLTYLLLFPFFRNKKIWLFMDRQDKADDNAEHLYKYAIEQNDGIKKYFTVKKDANDFKRLSILGNIIGYYTIKQRLIYLFAEKMISSHPDEIFINPFMGKNIKYYSGLIRLDKYFLQHGVTKDNVSYWLKKYDKNLKLIVCVSDLERKSFFDEGYNYSEDIIQTLGFPRFDNLIKKDGDSTKKQILIMPSWRRDLQNKNEEYIKDSIYYQKINSLLNNENLIEITKEYSYRIVFKPHPKVYDFIELFDENEYVEIDYNSTYQELFKESDLMITDYSSVAFDFSYLKKPIIYYQYGDDYHFEEGYFKYESMGFGEVIDDEADLIETIEEYLKNNCQIKGEYKKRADAFFKYDDENNCMRVYEWILND